MTVPQCIAEMDDVERIIQISNHADGSKLSSLPAVPAVGHGNRPEMSLARGFKLFSR